MKKHIELLDDLIKGFTNIGEATKIIDSDFSQENQEKLKLLTEIKEKISSDESN